MIVRASHAAAREAAVAVLAAYPEPLLQRAARYPVRLWLLDRGEPVASATLLDDAARARRWHDGQVGLADCVGLTVPVQGCLLVVAPWERPAVLRHELGHALSVLLNAGQRRGITRLFQSACNEDRLPVPLAGRAVGEYVACGLAHYAQPTTRQLLGKLDPELASLLAELWHSISAVPPGYSPAQGLARAVRTARTWISPSRWLPAPA